MKQNHKTSNNISSDAKALLTGKEFSALQRLFMSIAASLVVCTSADARVTKIVIDETLAMAPATNSTAELSTGAQTFVNGSKIPYEIIAGRAFGELDPKLPQNALIQDIELAKGADGKVRYVASFVLYKPIDPKQAACFGTTYQTVVACFRLPHKNRPLVTFCWQVPGRATMPALLPYDLQPA